ncbi:ketopantoate reductase family protein [Microbacterium sp. Marseille-Q6965]|uniref:ketopantoate reductase family protein n=1 Tax=Microbacterium sp. Marseille-Q6965 TaxID=2965072 RepID=UPI0021B723EA|nr:2-dehydropantoate 2-reductase [Microbacterium sp. Marseille-Q6965]
MIGLGALGGMYLDRIARGLPEADVFVIADAERADRLERDGVVINGREVRFPVVRPGNAAEVAELLIIATKAGGLEAAIELARPFVGHGTLILSLINGIHSEDALAEAFPEADVLLSMTAGSDVVRRGNDISYENFGRIAFGREADAPADDAVQRLDALLTEADVPHEVPADMRRTMWWKFMGNVGINPTSALLDAEYGAFTLPDSHAREVMLAAQREVIRIANAQWVDLGEADIQTWLRTVSTLAPRGETSMLQDMRAGRLTEVDIFSGVVVQLGQELGIPTPVNEMLLHGVKAREQILGAA